MSENPEIIKLKLQHFYDVAPKFEILRLIDELLGVYEHNKGVANPLKRFLDSAFESRAFSAYSKAMFLKKGSKNTYYFESLHLAPFNISESNRVDADSGMEVHEDPSFIMAREMVCLGPRRFKQASYFTPVRWGLHALVRLAERGRVESKDDVIEIMMDSFPTLNALSFLLMAFIQKELKEMNMSRVASASIQIPVKDHGLLLCAFSFNPTVSNHYKEVGSHVFAFDFKKGQRIEGGLPEFEFPFLKIKSFIGFNEMTEQQLEYYKDGLEMVDLKLMGPINDDLRSLEQSQLGLLKNPRFEVVHDEELLEKLCSMVGMFFIAHSPSLTSDSEKYKAHANVLPVID